MKAYIMQSRRVINPFDSPSCDCLIGNKTLAVIQKETFSRLGIEPLFVATDQRVSDPCDYILTDDNVYFSPELFAEFIARSQKQKKNTICSLKQGITTQRTMSGIQNVANRDGYVEYNLRYLAEERFRKGDCIPIVIDPDQFCEYFAVPKHICDNEKYLIPLTNKFVIQIDHWANLWAANIITTLMTAAKLQRESKMRLFLLAVKARSLNRWRILSRVNTIGRNCDIHPTAYIEGSIIGDSVKIGAGAIIRETIVGNGAFIGNSVTIEESVIGEKSTILHGHILYSALCSGVFSVASIISTSLIGKDTFVGGYVALADFRLDGRNVTVLKDGNKIDSGNRFLGCCLGNNVYLGSGCVVAPGRTIPNGLRITLEKDRIITECNPEEITKGFRTIKD